MAVRILPTVRWECPCGRTSKKTWGPRDVGIGVGYPTRRAKNALREHRKDCDLAKDGKVVRLG